MFHYFTGGLRSLCDGFDAKSIRLDTRQDDPPREERCPGCEMQMANQPSR